MGARYKLIPVRPETYKELSSLREGKESLDSVIRRLIEIAKRCRYLEAKAKICNSFHEYRAAPHVWVRIFKENGIDPEIGFRFLKPVYRNPYVFEVNDEACLRGEEDGMGASEG